MGGLPSFDFNSDDIFIVASSGLQDVGFSLPDGVHACKISDVQEECLQRVASLPATSDSFPMVLNTVKKVLSNRCLLDISFVNEEIARAFLRVEAVNQPATAPGIDPLIARLVFAVFQTIWPAKGPIWFAKLCATLRPVWENTLRDLASLHKPSPIVNLNSETDHRALSSKPVLAHPTMVSIPESSQGFVDDREFNSAPHIPHSVSVVKDDSTALPQPSLQHDSSYISRHAPVVKDDSVSLPQPLQSHDSSPFPALSAKSESLTVSKPSIVESNSIPSYQSMPPCSLGP